MEKKDFPNEKLITFYSSVKVKFSSCEELAYLVQFDKSLVSYSMESYGVVEKSDSDYEKGEIIHIDTEALFFWKKQGKSITVKHSPISFNDR